MWVPSTSRGLVVDYRRALIPLSLGLLLLVWLLAHPPFWVMLVLACLLPGLLTFEWLAVVRQRPAFDKEFSRLLQRSDVPGLHGLIDRSWALRRFGAPGYMDEKRGLVASLEGDWLLADRFLERAFVKANGQTKRTLLPAVLRAKYENGMWDEAESIARELLGKTRFPGTPELFLGLILARRQAQRPEAMSLLERAAQTLGGPDRARAERALGELEGAGSPGE